MPDKPILCLDFDGVLHAYTSGWRGPKIVADGPVPGAVEFLAAAREHFVIHIFSSRSGHVGGRYAMMAWLSAIVQEHFDELPDWFGDIEFPNTKPPALVTLDDRAITFTGTFPDPKELLEFKPWNKQ